MPSILLGRPYASGAVQLVSGNFWSGQSTYPVGGVRLRWISSGGQAYIGLSGGGPPLSGNFMTINSGGFGVSGGVLDGLPITPGGELFVPKIACGLSGNLSLFALFDPPASGIGRLFWECY